MLKPWYYTLFVFNENLFIKKPGKDWKAFSLIKSFRGMKYFSLNSDFLRDPFFKKSNIKTES